MALYRKTPEKTLRVIGDLINAMDIAYQPGQVELLKRTFRAYPRVWGYITEHQRFRIKDLHHIEPPAELHVLGEEIRVDNE